MNQLIRKLTTLATSNRAIFTSFSILLAALIIGFSITIPTGIYPSTFKSYYRAIPKIVWFNKVSPITNYSDLPNIIDHQPRISYRPSPKFFIIEVSDLDCVSCAQFHGYSNPKLSSNYKKILDDFVLTGKAAYTWIDAPSTDNNKKHTALYCAGEQSAKKFFSFREKEYESISAYNLDTIKKQAKEVGLNVSKLESCINSDSYKDRVGALKQFSSVILEQTQSPTLYVYSVTEESVKKIDGTNGKQKIAKQLATITSTSDYEFSIKPALDKAFK